jgi:hypothetical protein
MVLKVEGGVLPDFRVYGGKTFAKVEENNVNFFLRNKKRHRDSKSACSKKIPTYISQPPHSLRVPSSYGTRFRYLKEQVEAI